MLLKMRSEKKFSSEELSYFCDQVAMLLHGGVSISEGLYLLCQEMENGPMKEALLRIEEYVKARTPLYQALQKTKAFPDYMIHLIHIGETTGKLEDVMCSLSEHYERESKLKASIRSAIMYPFVLFLMMTAILFILVFKILPIFESMYAELSTDISSSSDNLMTFGIRTGTITSVIIGIIALIGLFLLLLSRTPKGSALIRDLGYTLRITRKISDMMSIGKYISSMALMISTGLETKKALELAACSSDNTRFKSKAKECIRLFDSGLSLENSICKANLLLGMEAGILLVAAKSGTTDIAFTKLGDTYNEKINAHLNKLSNYIETALTVILAVLLGVIMLSVMLPLINIISSMG